MCSGITSKDELLFIPTTVVGNFPLMGVVVDLNHRYAKAMISSLVLPSLSYLHCCHILGAELWQWKGIHCVADRTVDSRSSTGLCREQFPPPVAHSVYSDPAFLNQCCICLPCSKFSIKKGHCSLALVQIYLDKFISLRYGPFRTHCLLWKVMCPVCAKPPVPVWPAPVKIPVSSCG